MTIEAIADQVTDAIFTEKIKRQTEPLSAPLKQRDVRQIVQDVLNKNLPHLVGAPVAAKPLSVAAAIYEAYPRHVGRKTALAAIGRSLAAYDGNLLERVQAYAAAVAKWSPRERQFVPHPTTWFNQGRYADDPKEWERGVPSAAANTTDYSKF